MTDGPAPRIDGPPMICATKVLRPGGHRIGKIAGGVALPRTIPVVTAVFVVIFGILGLILSWVISGQPYSIGIGIGIGAAFGYSLATFSPLRGESMLTWLLLLARGRRRKQRIDGRPVSLAVGAAMATRVSNGPVVLRRASVRVNPNSRDDRGVLLDPSRPS
jgi:hypothetical protein